MTAACCARCSAETQAGVRCGLGVLCPRCASLYEQKAARGAPVPMLRRVGPDPGEWRDGLPSHRELEAIVSSRGDFCSAREEVEAQLRALQLLILAVGVLAPCSVLYFAWHGYRTLAWVMAALGGFSLAQKLLQGFELLGRRRGLVIRELEGEGAYRRYRRLREEMRHLDDSKQRLLRKQILPKLRAMMEEKLPYLLQRRFEFASFLRAYELPELEAEAAGMEDRLKGESDSEVREALAKRLGLARARRDHYVALERRMRLYQIHLANLETHMENLVARVIMLDPNEDFRAATEALMRGLTEEVELLEEAYEEVRS